jgi:hypothetical protein
MLSIKSVKQPVDYYDFLVHFFEFELAALGVAHGIKKVIWNGHEYRQSH